VIRAIDHIVEARAGEGACGDIAVVRTDGARTLLAVIDALGHGKNAEEVAIAARDWLVGAALDAGVEELVRGLHGELRGTRGACGLVCIVDETSIEGCSVGNVEMRWSKSRPAFVLTPGVLGHRIERPRIFRMQPSSAERVVLFTDGISARFDLRQLGSLSTAEACRAIFTHHRRPHDDATVLVADFES
jgi:negative regulator of sigma-B (phosphoserine phosphatase)